MKFIGDVHGKFDSKPKNSLGLKGYVGYFDLINGKKDPKGNRMSKGDQTIQVGDMGFGFRDIKDEWNLRHLFIRGNHDNPAECRKHPNYLGEYGTYRDIGYISGAFSIDWQWRKQAMGMGQKDIWWKDEELSQFHYENIQFDPTMKKILSVMSSGSIRIMVTHDCPAEIRGQILGGNSIDKQKEELKNTTSDGILQGVFDMQRKTNSQPEVWIFGHYHTSWRKKIDGTLFVCLDELEVSENF